METDSLVQNLVAYFNHLERTDPDYVNKALARQGIAFPTRSTHAVLLVEAGTLRDHISTGRTKELLDQAAQLFVRVEAR